MDIRQLQLLIALERERHFTRAASACHLTQPTLSSRLRQLEQELGVQLVERGQRFHGFTREGQLVLKWAHAIIDNCQAMLQELSALKGDLCGRLVLGVIPSALPVMARLTAALHGRFPRIGFTILSQSSEEIRQHLESFRIDAGVTYLDNEPLERVRTQPLFVERYCLYVKNGHPLASRRTVTWTDAAGFPLSLLTPNMQNRRIIDAAFRGVGCEPRPEMETNSVITLCAHVRSAGHVAVIPALLAELMGENSGLTAVPLVEPVIEHSIGLVTLDRERLSPVVEALFRVAAVVDLLALDTDGPRVAEKKEEAGAMPAA